MREAAFVRLQFGITNLVFQKVFSETPAERARHYRTLAMTSEANAAATPLPALRAAYLRSADRWNTLASLLELGSNFNPRKIAAAPRPRRRPVAAATPATVDHPAREAADRTADRCHA